MIEDSFTLIVLDFLQKYGILTAFLGGFVTGESVIITLAFLSANGYIPLWWILVFSTLGLFLSDFIPFFIGRLRIFKKFTKYKRFAPIFKRIDLVNRKFSKDRLFLTLLYGKFIYGLSIPVIMYFSSKKVSLKKFIINDFFVVVIYMFFIVSIGYFAGKGFNLLLEIFRSLRIALLFLILLIIIIYLLRKWMSIRLLNRKK